LCSLLLIYTLPLWSESIEKLESVKTETLIFSIDYLSVSVASVEFVHSIGNNTNGLTVSAKSSSLSNVFAQNFDNVYRIEADSTFRPILYSKSITQKNFTEDSNTVYCYTNLQATYTNNITDLNHYYRVFDDTRDFFSALYYLRNVDIKSDNRFTIDAAGKLWTINSKFIGTESIRASIGNFTVNRIEISFTPIDDVRRLRSDILTNNLVSEHNKLHLWFTDDQAQIPVRASYIMQPFNVTWSIRERL
jgi:hypothetical protein